MVSKNSNSGSKKGAASQVAASAGQGAAAAATAPAAAQLASNYSIYKIWGGKHQFMLSYGLKPGEPGAYAKARKIVEAFKAYDAQEAEDDRAAAEMETCAAKSGPTPGSRAHR